LQQPANAFVDAAVITKKRFGTISKFVFTVDAENAEEFNFSFAACYTAK
jgi:hypothetical protein